LNRLRRSLITSALLAPLAPRALAEVLALRPLAPGPSPVALEPAAAERAFRSLHEATAEWLAARHDAELDQVVAEWPTAFTLRETVARTLPVLRYWPDVLRLAPADTRAWVTQLDGVVRSLAWRQTYAAADVPGEFLDRYGYSEFIGLQGAVPSERLAVGVLLLGPGVLYPRHRHEADELYVPLSGHAEWQQGDAPWRRVEPGRVLHHPSEAPHAMRTLNEPLLALYVWRTRDLSQHARFDPPLQRR